MDNDRADGPQRARLPGFEDPAEPRRPAYNWYPSHGGPPPGYPWPMGYARDDGIRSSRRTSSWTAAALIAGVAATTGYLAHSIPGTGTTTTTGKTTAHHKGRATVVPPAAPAAPVVAPPVTTSGGSGAAAGAGGGGD